MIWVATSGDVPESGSTLGNCGRSGRSQVGVCLTSSIHNAVCESHLHQEALRALARQREDGCGCRCGSWAPEIRSFEEQKEEAERGAARVAAEATGF